MRMLKDRVQHLMNDKKVSTLSCSPPFGIFVTPVVVVCVMQTAGVGVAPSVNSEVRQPTTQQRRSLNLDDYKKKRGLI